MVGSEASKLPIDAPLAPEELIGDDGGPPIVAVVIIDRVSNDLERTLESVAAQDYPNLSFLVIDAADGEPITETVARVLPDAYLHRMPQRLGRANAANKATELVTGASFYLFVTVGNELESNVTSALVEELYRSNAGIVGPKVVDADDPRRLRSVGMGADRFGVEVDYVEPGEFDQEQYDTVRDIFFAPSGVQLIRADLFAALGGFDPAITSFGDDLDLCWRAHIAGARVVAVPRAVTKASGFRAVGSKAAGSKKAGSGESSSEQDVADVDPDERRRLLGRHRLRSLLVTASGWHLVRYLPLAILLLLLEALYSLVAGRRRQARAAIGAITWNLSNLGQIRQRRKSMASLRGVSDREVGSLQASGSARLSGFFRGQFDVGDRVVSFAGTFRDSFTGQDAGAFRDGFIISSLIGLILVIGSRGLLTNGVTATGQFLDLPGASTLLSEYLGDWRTVGVGGRGNSATAFGVLGLAKVLFFWGTGLLDTLLVIGPLFLGPIGAWRLARPYGTIRSSAFAALAYAANPVAVAAVSAGRWDSLVVYGSGPFIVGSLLRVQGAAPYGSSGGSIGQGIVERSLAVRLVRFGLLIASVATFVPAVIIVALVMIVGLIVGSLLVAKTAGLMRLVLAAVVSVAAPAALHAPWTFDILQRGSWRWFVGPGSPESAFDSLADLVRFAPGQVEPRLLAVGILLAASLALLIGTGVRLEAGVRGWSMAVVAWLLIWSDRRGWLSLDLPTAELLLVPAAAGLALSIGAAARAVEIDLVGFRFGWRQVAAFCGVVAMAGAGILLLRHSYSGRWDLPEQSYVDTTDLLAAQLDGPARVLWIGDPSILPVDALESDAGITYAITEGGEASALARFTPGNYGLNSQIGEQLDLALDNQTVRLGRLLAPYGVDFVVVVPRLAPAPYVGRTFESPQDALTSLLGQLDLERISGVADFTVFRNESANGPVVGVETDIAALVNRADVFLDTDLAVGRRLRAEPGSGSWTWTAPPPDPETDGTLPDPASVLIAVTGDGWKVSGEGVTASPTEGGLLALYPNGTAAWSVERPTPLLRWLMLVGQAILVAVGIAVARSEDPVR